MKVSEIDTPALLLDLDAMERNLEKMARFFSGGTRLRPHYKNHKCPELARRQIARGAIGLTCATLSEAEALVANDIDHILISSEIAGAPRIRRFIQLARSADVMAVVDNPDTAAAIGTAARNARCRPGLLVNVNVGQNRTGAKPGVPVLDLARRIAEEGMKFRGLMGYEGHVAHMPEGAEKISAYDLAMRALMNTKRLLEENGFTVGIVSTGGTGTYHLSRRFPEITEFQAGSYLLMDTDYKRTCEDFEPALSVLGTVISRTGNERVVIDAGLKSISGEHGVPLVKSVEGLKLRKLNAEHGIIDIVDPGVQVQPGDTIEVWAHYSDATVNLHDRIYGMRNGVVEEILKLQG